jgi:glycosyltransferase involved in cell wall biosynthesis
MHRKVRTDGPAGASFTVARQRHPVTVALFRRLASAVAESRPDVIHVHGTRLRQAWVIDWAAARGIPTMYTEHVTLDERDGAVDADAIDSMRHRCGVLACVSERSRDSLRAAVGASTPVEVLRHVVTAAKVVAPASSGPLRALTVARLERYKGIDVLLHALARARAAGAAVELSIAGDGAERSALQALAQTLGLTDVRFLGGVAPDAIAGLLQGADLMVLPSRGEGLPVAIVEAMAQGRPVLATRVGGNAEVVMDGVTGRLVPVEDAEELARALVQLAADRAALERMGVAARRAWEEGDWTPQAVVARTLELYRTAAQRQGAR